MTLYSAKFCDAHGDPAIEAEIRQMFPEFRELQQDDNDAGTWNVDAAWLDAILADAEEATLELWRDGIVMILKLESD